MLVLARKDGEGIRVGDEITITVISSSGGQVRLGIEAPSRVTIHREEIYDMIVAANRAAINAPTSEAPLEPLEQEQSAPRAPIATGSRIQARPSTPPTRTRIQLQETPE